LEQEDLFYHTALDATFPLKPYLLRPYPGRGGLTPERDIFNYRLSRARRVIENAFGILASRWRIYRKPIIASTKNATLMIQATICLHNWLQLQDKDDINSNVSLMDIDSMEDGRAFKNISNCGSNMSAKECVKIRDKFCYYFNNDGAVPWQNDRNK